MNTTWADIVEGFQTTPFLFVGSGLSRRYYQLPCWFDLLQHFANKVSKDEFYLQKLMSMAGKDLPAVGSLLEKDFNDRWFSNPEFRIGDITGDSSVKEAVRRGVSPFKAEVARFLANSCKPDPMYNTEMELLQSLADRHLSGFITTNYDNLLEKIAPFYKVFVGQDDLLLSNPQCIGEIFKIHGTLKSPESIVLTREDYELFSAKRAYLAAKLLTIFIEYPVIFIGYSLNDPNVQAILCSIVDCLDKDRLDKLAKTLVFVERDKSLGSSIDIQTHAREINGKTLVMTNVRTNDFYPLFEGLKEKERSAPVKLLRMFREQLYLYSITSKPTKHLVVNVGDPRIPENKLVFNIGIDPKSLEKGLIGITREEWMKEVILSGTTAYSEEQLLELGYEQVKRISAGADLPVFKFLSKVNKTYPFIKEVETFRKYDDLLSPTLIKKRKKGGLPKTVQELYENKKFSGDMIYEGWALLPEQAVDIEELEKFLEARFKENPDLIISAKPQIRSAIYRVIRIYDWLKYKKEKPITS